MTARLEKETQRRIKVALVGAGYFGHFQMNAWNRLEEVELVAVADPSSKIRSNLRNHVADEKIFTSLDDLLGSVKPDLIDIATPPASHKKLIEECAGNVQTIICQKPFCGNIETAKSAVKIADENNTTLVVHENFRFMPWYRAIKTQIDDDQIGTIRQVMFRFRPGDGNGPDAYLARQPYFQSMPRFLVHETAIHWIDTFRFLFGEPDSIYADLWRTNPAISGEDSGLLILGYENGQRIVFDGSRALDHQAENHRLTMGELLVEGSLATVRLDGDGRIFRRKFGYNDWHEVEYVFQDLDFGGDCVYHFQEHVVSHLLDGTSLETQASDYLRNLEIVEAAYLSDRQSRQIRL